MEENHRAKDVEARVKLYKKAEIDEIGVKI